MDWFTLTWQSFCYGPFLVFFTMIFVPAAFGKSIGFRRKYVQVLVYLFEYGKRRIDKAISRQRDWEVQEEEKEVYFTTSSSENSDQESESAGNVPRSKTVAVVTPPTNIVRTTRRRLSICEDEDTGRSRTFSVSAQDSIQEEEGQTDFLLTDIFEFVTSGVNSIVKDQVTQRFVAEELKSWNLLTRTNRHYEFISFRLSLLWLLGCLLRYWILFPIRVVFFVVSLMTLVLTTSLIGLLPNSFQRKREIHDICTRFSHRLFSRSFSLIATYHQTENKPRPGGICVANHTTVMDIVPMGCETSFALIGQTHGGFLGFLQFVLGRASDHIFFERAEAKDRLAVTGRLREHVQDPNKLPVLIFPEGTCINNSAVMQFKKGSFEVGGTVYPVAIKYDPRFGDAFWNSSEQSMLQYLFMIMTSWAIVCDVWYLPPMHRQEGETAIAFANRVKAEIARAGGLVDLDWDGQLKRYPAKPEWKEKEQLKYSKKLSSTQHNTNHVST